MDHISNCTDQILLLNELNEKIIQCKLCPRLIKYIKEVDLTRTKKYVDQDHWSKPVPSFGDPNCKLLVVGLAPAANGGNRTGRMFTGDSSGDWLVRALFETGFANRPLSISKDDGLILKDVYITAVAHCAPPQNKLNSLEISNCSRHLISEIKLLNNTTKVVIVLGKVAFDTYCKISDIKGLKFCHNNIYPILGDKTLIVSYHPSKRNTSTRILTWDMWINIFKSAKTIINKTNK